MFPSNYKGEAYYYWKSSDGLEFGYFTISKFDWSNLLLECEIHYFFGYYSNITGKTITSNQLHGQNQVRNIYENWHKDLNKLDHNLIIKTIFSSPIKFIGEVK